LTQEARRTVEAPRADRELTARRLPAIIGKISALRAPDQDWATVRDGWVAAWEQYLKLLSSGSDLGAMEEALALQRDLIERTELLRLRYRTNASRVVGKDL
jgi:hypothetical protein